MTRIIANPPLIDFLTICMTLPVAEQEQIEAFTGQPYNADHAANGNFNLSGPKWGLYADNGYCLAIGGFMPSSPGVYRDWLLTSPVLWRTPCYWRSGTRQIRKLMDEVFAHPDVHALECYSLATRTTAHRWYRTLGYVYETTLAKRANGVDVVVYSRVKQ